MVCVCVCVRPLQLHLGPRDINNPRSGVHLHICGGRVRDLVDSTRSKVDGKLLQLSLWNIDGVTMVLMAFDMEALQPVEPLLITDMLLRAAAIQAKVSSLRLHTGLQRVVSSLCLRAERGESHLMLMDQSGEVARARSHAEAAPGYSKLHHHHELVEFATLQIQRVGRGYLGRLIAGRLLRRCRRLLYEGGRSYNGQLNMVSVFQWPHSGSITIEVYSPRRARLLKTTVTESQVKRVLQAQETSGSVFVADEPGAAYVPWVVCLFICLFVVCAPGVRHDACGCGSV